MRRDRFVNPYQFVPLPRGVDRSDPPGHDGRDAAERFTGTLELSWTLRTPMLLPRGEAAGTRQVSIPGSSIKGAVRSVHEAMFGGCLRVVDTEFLPSYREPAANKAGDKNGEWFLAQVYETTIDGRPLKVDVCWETDWVDGPSLFRAYARRESGRLPQVGDIVELDGEAEDTTLERWEMRSVRSVGQLARPREAPVAVTRRLASRTSEGMRILLVTDVGARRQTKRNGDRARALWACGTIKGDLIDVDPGAADQFRLAADGADDRRRLLSDGPGSDKARVRVTSQDRDRWGKETRYTDVSWWDSYEPGGRGMQPIARRALTTGLLFPGDVVWVRIARGAEVVNRVDQSRLWRTPGRHSLVERIPADALPCPHTRDDGLIKLCPTCQIFGAAETDDTDSEVKGGEQRSYAGHVRFGTARTQSNVQLTTIDLAPLGAPSPGAGGFYLQDRALPPNRDRADRPGHWGDSPDRTGVRQLRGRKFFWHVDPAAQAQAWTRENGRPMTPRYVRQARQQKQDEARVLVPAGTEFRQRVTVDAITVEGLQTLLAALDPARMLGTGQWAHHLGGGKPFGLGSATCVIRSESQVSTTRHRYTSDVQSAVPGPDRAVLDPAADRTAIQVLARLMAVDGLGEWQHHVAYPTTVSWERVESEEFRQSYDFFTSHNGERLARGEREWFPLPTPPPDRGRGFDPTLPIVAKDRRR